MCEMDQYGHTPLLFAAEQGHLEVVEYLVEKGADTEATDRVSDVIIDMSRNLLMNTSGWKDCTRPRYGRRP